MAVKRLLIGAWLLAGASSGCGGEAVPLSVDERADAERAEAEPAGPSTGLSPLLPGAAEEGEANDADTADERNGGEGASLEPASCDPAECPEVLLFGVLAPGCCRFGNLCGGRVQVSERTSACLAPEVNEQGEELRNALTRASREPFAPDLACPSHIFDGDELSGCCRAGVCGVDTQAWTRSAAAFGLVLPRACLDPREAAELAAEPPSSVPPPRCGN